MDLNTLDALVAPATLFFVLGIVAGLVRSDLAVPEQVSRGLALYLMLCIGFKGGVEAQANGLDATMLSTGLAGLLLSFATPFLVFGLFRSAGRLDRATSAAAAAAYGSVSVVTFAAASEFLTALGRPPAGYMAAVLALMETPAILAGLLLARRAPDAAPTATASRTFHEVLFNGALMVLVGSFLIGLATGEPGMAKLDPFVNGVFQGALCFFLLDMGLTAARSFEGRRDLHPRLLALAVAVPLAGATVALGASRLLDLPPSEATMLMVLTASASYIAVPAAMRLALPQATAGVYVTLPLAVTFPFNLLLGIPLYAWAASALR